MSETPAPETFQNSTTPPIFQNTWLSWALAFLVVALTVLLLPRSYSENDDVGMVLQLEQGFHPVFFSALLSEAMIRLYRQWPGVPWYALYHYLMLTLSLGTGFCLLLRQTGRRLLTLLLAIGLGLLFINFVTQITFTYTGILLCGVGLLSFIAAMRASKENDSPALNMKTALLCGVLFALGWATRFESPQACLFLLPAVTLLAWRSCNRLKTQLKTLWLALLLFIFPLAVFVTLEQTIHLRTPAEQTHGAFLKSASKLVGMRYTRANNFGDLMTRFDWSPTDLAILKHFLFVDDQVFSKTRIDQLASQLGGQLTQTATDLLKPAYLAGKLGEYFQEVWFSQRSMSFMLPGVLLLVLGLGWRRGRTRWLALGSLGFFLTASFGMFYFIRFPERVGYPLFWVVSLGTLLSLAQSTDQDADDLRTRPAKLGVLGLVVLLGISIGCTVYQTRKMPRKIEAYQADHQALQQLGTTHYILRSSNTVFSKWLDPLQTRNLTLPDTGPGWLAFSPLFYQRLNQLGLREGAELMPWMVDNPHALVISKKMHIPLVIEFMRDHYGKNVTIVLQGHLPKHSESLIYCLKSAEQSAKTQSFQAR